jgi:hypothetical protein
MRFYVRLVRDSDGWIAGNESSDDVGRGATREEALAELKAVLADRFGRVEAVAPPSRPRMNPTIDLVVLG